MAEVLSTVEDAAAIVVRGGIVVVPTETVYGLACLPRRQAVERIFELKQRPADKNMQLLVPDASWLARLAEPTDVALALAQAFWPGPLTLVARAGEHAPTSVASDGTIGLRVPGHDVALDLLARSGPLAASSANRSGDPTPATISEIVAVFGGDVDAYLDGGRISGSGSTVIDVTGTPKILRPGPISSLEIEAVIGGSI